MSRKRAPSEISSPNPHTVSDIIPSMEFPEDPDEALRFFFGEHAISSSPISNPPANDWRRFIRTTPPPDPAGDVLNLDDLGDVQLDGESLDLDFAHETDEGPSSFDFNTEMEGDPRPFGTVPEGPRSAFVAPSETAHKEPIPVPPEDKLTTPLIEDMDISAQVQEHIRNATRQQAADAQPGHRIDRPAKRRKPVSAIGEAGERPAKKRRRPRRKKDDPEPDYSAIVREQVRNSTRTGQACDRCKVCYIILFPSSLSRMKRG